jgi:hypothetical protein
VRVFDGIYWALPHLELFDMSKREVHNWPAAPLWVLAILTLYGAVYSTVFMSIGMRRFYRMNL